MKVTSLFIISSCLFSPVISRKNEPKIGNSHIGFRNGDDDDYLVHEPNDRLSFFDVEKYNKEKKCLLLKREGKNCDPEQNNSIDFMDEKSFNLRGSNRV